MDFTGRGFGICGYWLVVEACLRGSALERSWRDLDIRGFRRGVVGLLVLPLTFKSLIASFPHDKHRTSSSFWKINGRFFFITISISEIACESLVILFKVSFLLQNELKCQKLHTILWLSQFYHIKQIYYFCCLKQSVLRFTFEVDISELFINIG